MLKKILQKLPLFFLLFWMVSGCAQSEKKQYSPYGGVFTPKGTLRVLIVFVSYKDKTANPNFENANFPMEDWDYNKNNKLPSFVNPETGACPKYIFNQESDFETYIDEVKNNYSKEFALMSNHQFKFIGEVFSDASGKPTVVEIDPTNGYSWTNMNERAVEAMQKINPNVDLSRFDQRENLPNFKFDNSDTSSHKPDKILDFVVFVHRYNTGWAQEPKVGMKAWIGSTGGFASTGVGHKTRLNGYRIAEGFTMTYNSGVFIHEVAHILFNAPHIMGVNNVVGDYFYLMNAGWGIMAPISIFSGFNAWERWYAGFIELAADIKGEEDLKNGNTFVLRDYFTTGEAMRIEIPFSGGQYLWLENHTKIHPLDEHPWKGKDLGNGDILAGTAAGVYAYVESVESSRNTIFSPLSNRANGIKVLHAGGNYDYELVENLVEQKNAWGNVLKSFRRLEANPISGINNFYRFPCDSDKDGIIKIDQNYNSSKTEWYPPIYREEVAPDSFVNTYGGFGIYNEEKCRNYVKPVPFQGGTYLDMSSNPKPLNYPVYDMKNAVLNPYILNGLAVKFSAIEGSKDMLIEIKFKHTALCENQRWTGNIELPNITGDEQADLELANCTILTLDKSGTPNTHLRTTKGDFIAPTVLTIKKGATLHLRQKSKLLLRNGSKLVLEEGANLILDKNTQLVVSAGSELVLNGNTIQKHPSAKVQNNK